jgi:hypothetical protein
MAKASLKLPNGTVVTLEGTPDEVKHLLELYGGERESSATSPRQPRKARKPPSGAKQPRALEVNSDDRPNLNQIVTITKDCDEAEAIEKQILDRPAQVNRTLLPLYIVHEHLDNAFGLTSGDVKKVTTDLGIPISQPNASRTLSGTASKYVIGDKVKVKGQAVRYKLSRRGIQYMKEVLAGNGNG